jgi:uncharacterized membrane protein (DUF485 family)
LRCRIKRALHPPAGQANLAPMGPDTTLHDIARRRWRFAGALSLFVAAIYFGFILLIAFNKPLLATLVMPGLSLGILLGAFVIVASWLATWIYVRWANGPYDAALHRLRGGTK